MEISETGIGYYLSFKIVDVEIDIKQDIIDLILTKGVARVVGSEVLLILSLQSFNCLILSSDTNIIEVMRGIWTPEVFNVEHGNWASGYLVAFLGRNIDSHLYSIIIDDTDLVIIEPLKLLSNHSNVLTITRLHYSFRNFHIICLIKSVFNDKVVFFLIEVKVEHKIRGK